MRVFVQPSMNEGAVKCVDGYDHDVRQRDGLEWCIVCDDDPFTCPQCGADDGCLMGCTY